MSSTERAAPGGDGGSIDGGGGETEGWGEDSEGRMLESRAGSGERGRVLKDPGQARRRAWTGP